MNLFLLTILFTTLASVTGQRGLRVDKGRSTPDLLRSLQEKGKEKDSGKTNRGGKENTGGKVEPAPVPATSKPTPFPTSSPSSSPSDSPEPTASPTNSPAPTTTPNPTIGSSIAPTTTPVNRAIPGMDPAVQDQLAMTCTKGSRFWSMLAGIGGFSPCRDWQGCEGKGANSCCVMSYCICQEVDPSKHMDSCVPPPVMT